MGMDIYLNCYFWRENLYFSPKICKFLLGPNLIKFTPIIMTLSILQFRDCKRSQPMHISYFQFGNRDFKDHRGLLRNDFIRDHLLCAIVSIHFYETIKNLWFEHKTLGHWINIKQYHWVHVGFSASLFCLRNGANFDVLYIWFIVTWGIY
jgi:hypothetical protein